MTKTEHYGLPQWEPTDRVLREDFNDMTEQLESELTKMAEKIPRIASGSYKGTGEYAFGSDFSKVLEFGFAAQLVIVLRSDNNIYLSAIFVRPCERGICGFGNGESIDAAWSSTGLAWQSIKDYNYQLNANNVTYYWLAIG